jgi:Kef-type K+ transport system membrane component KefB
MYHFLVNLLQELEPPYILLIQASIAVAFPYFLWRVCRFQNLFPLVVVQIFAGVLLGPGIFGAIDAALLNSMPHFDPAKPVNACTNPEARELFNALFGKTCYLGNEIVNRAAGIGAVATIAVCLFGFVAGTDADKELIRKSEKTVFNTAFWGMLFGWALAAVAGYFIMAAFPQALGPKASALSFPLAYGLIIAVSALPVLAVILGDLDITRTRIGGMALASASIADTMMWFGLGLVVATTLVGSLPVALTKATLGVLLSIGFIKYVATPIFNRMLRENAPGSAIITLSALAIFVSSSIIGIADLHPVLGAFIAGFFLPDKVREIASHRFDQTATLVLMPFFFLNAGLHTDFSIFAPTVWILFVLTTILCVFCKMIGHGVAAKLSGEGWPFASTLGLLLQTKGLMGLIVIVVFLEKGVVSPLMFSAAVFMCMFSTALSAPAYRALYRVYGPRMQEGDQRGPQSVIKRAGPMVEQTPEAAALVAASPPMASLEFEGEFGAFDVMPGSVTIGRHSGNDLRVHDVRVSRHHARLTVAHDGRFEIENLTADRAAPVPLTVNGVDHERAILSEGDKVGLGGGPAFVIHYATLLQQRGWIKTSRGWAGPYKTKYGQWPGIVELADDLVKPYIRNPPASLRQHPQWTGFHEQASGWFRIDVADLIDRDPNAVIRNVESMIVSAEEKISDTGQDPEDAANSGSRPTLA